MMKYLKLDARHPECHGLARALVGSKCALSKPAVTSGRIGFELVQTLQDVFLVCRVDENPKWESVTPHQSIYIPLDILKLCPYVAMREGVGVVAYYDNSTYCDRTTGTIFNATSEGNFSFHAYGNEYGVEEIHLDLDNLPKGAEVEEL